MNTVNKKDEFFKSNIKNMIERTEHQNYPHFSLFLDSHQKILVAEILQQTKFTSFQYYGGYPDAQRVMLGVYPEYVEDIIPLFPLKVVEFQYRKNDQLTHRDFLGALMSCQIKREMLGDILIEQGLANVFVQQTIVDYIVNQIQKIGHVGVKAVIKQTPSIEYVQKFRELSGTVASFRLDCILSLITKLSRTKTVELIQAGKVVVNDVIQFSPSIQLKAKDIISVRGYGKFILTESSHKTKKDRYFIFIHQFI